MSNRRLLLREEKCGLVGIDPVDGLPFICTLSDIPNQDRALLRVVSNPRPAGATFSAPLYLSVFITLACNKHCAHCDFSSILAQDAKAASVMTRGCMLRMLDVCESSGVLGADILGGEPLHPLSSSLALEMAQRLLECGTTVSITTNGITLRKHIGTVRGMQDHYGDRFRLVVSLNPGDEARGCFPAIMKSLRAVGEAGVKISMNVIGLTNTVDAYDTVFGCVRECCGPFLSRIKLLYPRLHNRDRLAISSFVALSESLSMRHPRVQIEPEVPYHYRYQKLPRPTDEDMLLVGCGAAKRTVAIAPDGRLYACRGLICQDRFQIGSIFDDPGLVWQRAVSLRNKIPFKTTLACDGQCKYYVICDGCVADALRGTEPECEYRAI